MSIRAIQSYSPYTQELHYQDVFLNSEEVEYILSLSDKTLVKHRSGSYETRKFAFLRLKELLEKDKIELAQIASLEMGKLLSEAIAEIEKCAHLCGFYAERAEQWLKPAVIEKNNQEEKRIENHPLGIVLSIMPWNFPFWQVFRCAVPAVLAGNVVLLKHAPNVPLCALKIEELFLQAGFEKGIFQNLFIAEEQVAQLIQDPRVKAISLTGSEKAGRAVAETAGKHLKKLVLELGGSDPFIVLEDANIEEAVQWAVKSRLINNGQSCIAAKRFIIQENVYDAFLSLLKERLSVLKFGDPMDDTVNIGPLARLDLADQLRSQVEEAVKAEARIEENFFFSTENPHFTPITILTNVSKNNPVYYQELFGPVFMLFKVKDQEEALALANDSPFGLGASVWTHDKSAQDFFIEGLESGSVAINSMMASNALMPFGGIKNSGYGRELAEEGLKEFCNVKSVIMKY